MYIINLQLHSFLTIKETQTYILKFKFIHKHMLTLTYICTHAHTQAHAYNRIVATPLVNTFITHLVKIIKSTMSTEYLINNYGR